jgi:hypothetical protein
MFLRLRRFRNVHILLISLLISGCASVQRAILEANTLEADVTNSVPTEQSSPNNVASANASADPAAKTDQKPAPQPAAGPVTTSEISPRQTGCNRNKVISVGMTVTQLYASCWGKPKSINISVMGSTKTEMLLYEGYNYVYAENGIVKSIETSDR